MPTAPKLVAALWFGLVAWFASQLVVPYLPEGMPTGNLHRLSAAVGFLTGWIFLGRRAGDTMAAAYGYGLTGSALIVFWSIFFVAFDTMIERSLDRRYPDPTDAIIAMFDLIREYGVLVAKWDIVIVLVVGGLFGGWLVEKVAARWP